VADAAAPPIGWPGAELTPRRRVAALATVCVSLMVITIDVTILNVALPTLATALDADTSALQWFINAYELVFAGLLLTAGSLADRFGRRRILTIGLAVFGAASAASAVAGSASVGFPPFRGGLLIADGASHSLVSRCQRVVPRGTAEAI
jgi:MFS family permease